MNTRKNRTAYGYGEASKVAYAVGLMVLGAATTAQGATVIFESSNTDIYLDAGYTELEDPVGMLSGCTVLEHRDAGYPCDEDGGSVRYEDWAVNDPCEECDDFGCIDGYRNEIWLRAAGDAATTTTTRPSTAVSIHLYGDSNDGLAEVLVDNCRVAELDMFTSPGTQQALIIVNDLPFGTHEIRVIALDWGDVAVMGGTAIQCPVSSCSTGKDSNETNEDVATIDYGDDYMEKTVDLIDDPATAISARLWLFGQPYNYPNESYEAREDYKLRFNGDLNQELRFDVGQEFDYREDVFQWIALDVDPAWLSQGLNTVRLSYSGPSGSWINNNLRVGVDTENDVDRSWWHGNGVTTCNNAPQNCSGELMIFIELCFEQAPAPALVFDDELDQPCLTDVDCPNRSACVESPDGSGSMCYVPRNRYLSFDTNCLNHGQQVAFRIDLLNSEYCSDSTGFESWVGEPDADGIAHAVAFDDRWVSNMDGGDWPEIVHVAGCPIVPVATYDIIAMNSAGEAAPLELPTIFRPGSKFWADCVGQYDGTKWTPPQGTTNIDDAVAAIKTWQRAGSEAHLSWVDVDDEQVNHIMNINDVFMIIQGLKGLPYPYSCPENCP